MRAGRTRSTALACLVGLLAVVGVRAPVPSHAASHRPVHGVHLVAAATAPQSLPRLDLHPVLPVRRLVSTDLRRLEPGAASVPPLGRAPVSAPARGPPGEPA
jgi:hypothetical protein